MTAPVLLAVEQLRRRVPGGVGRYATGLLQGLLDVPAPPIALLASRHVGSGPDPLGRWGFEVRCSRIPAPLLTVAWDHGLAPAPRGEGVVHSVSLAAPPVRPPRPRGGRPLVVTVHDLAWRTHPDATTPRGRRWHEAALGRALVRADGFVVPSAPVAAALVAAGADPARVRVIPHGADHLPAPDEVAATKLLRRLGIAGDYLLAAGTLEPRKNLDRLAQAYTAARPSLPGPWPLLVVGPSGWGEMRSRGTEGVVLAGRVDDAVLASLYAGARVFAYVPLEEGFGFPPVEAMASGVPVVVSSAVPSVRGPIVAESSHEEPPALVVDPCSVEEIAAALVRVGCDDALGAELARRGAEHVASSTWAASARAHIGWWEELR